MNTRLWATWFIEIGAAIASLDEQLGSPIGPELKSRELAT